MKKYYTKVPKLLLRCMAIIGLDLAEVKPRPTGFCMLTDMTS